LFTGLRYVVELCASILASGELRQYRTSATRSQHVLSDARTDHDARLGVNADWRRWGDDEAEMREAMTSHKVPKRFWKCLACKREGHVFE